jgi:hypothetical protein
MEESANGSVRGQAAPPLPAAMAARGRAVTGFSQACHGRVKGVSWTGHGRVTGGSRAGHGRSLPSVSGVWRVREEMSEEREWGGVGRGVWGGVGRSGAGRSGAERVGRSE